MVARIPAANCRTGAAACGLLLYGAAVFAFCSTYGDLAALLLVAATMLGASVGFSLHELSPPCSCACAPRCQQLARQGPPAGLLLLLVGVVVVQLGRTATVLAEAGYTTVNANGPVAAAAQAAQPGSVYTESHSDGSDTLARAFSSHAPFVVAPAPERTRVRESVTVEERSTGARLLSVEETLAKRARLATLMQHVQIQREFADAPTCSGDVLQGRMVHADEIASAAGGQPGAATKMANGSCSACGRLSAHLCVKAHLFSAILVSCGYGAGFKAPR